MTVWDPRSSIMTAGAARCPDGWFGAPLNLRSGSPPTPLPLGAAAADTGGWGGCSPSSRREEDKAYRLWSLLSPHSRAGGRLYSFQGKSENRNEMKCKRERGRGRNTDMRRTKSSTTRQKHHHRAPGQAHPISPLIRLGRKRELGTLERQDGAGGGQY